MSKIKVDLDIMQCLIKNSTSPKEHIIRRYMKFVNYCINNKFTGYTENHHIIPRSFKGGTDNKDNLVRLGARHHYIAHLLLAKGTNSPKMIKALHRMMYSTTGDVRRDYRITSRVYAYVREKHTEIVSAYSKNTVVARQIYTEEIKRVPKKLFDKYNGVLYEALAKGRQDSNETKIKKSAAARKPRKAIQGARARSLAAAKYSYNTPLGFCENSGDLLKLYPTFTKNTLTMLDDNVIISNKFASIHTDFLSHIGKSFKEYGIIKLKRG